jgi:hypothetical protein
MQTIVQRLLLLCYCLLAGCLTLFTLYLCYAIEWRGPFRDLWEFMGIIEGDFNGRWDIQALIAPYGGIHRILIPKLLFCLDYRFAAGSNLLALSVTLLLHIAACGLLIYKILPGRGFTRADTLLLLASILLFFFSSTQIYNLVYISDNQVVISNSLAVLAAFIFCRYLYSNKTACLYIANILVVLACLSHASGLMMWPAIIVILLVLGKEKKVIFGQIIAACLLLALYVSGHDPLQDSTAPLPLWNKLLNLFVTIAVNASGILRYIGLHLSSPTSREYPLAGMIITYLSIGYLLTVAYRIYTKRWQPQHSEIFFLTIACYGVFIAVITAYGRQIYPNSALTDRYQTLVMSYWAAMMILLYCDLKKHWPALRFITAAFTLSLLLPYQYKNAEAMAWLSSRVNIAHTAAIVGITDIDVVAATLSHPLLMDKKNLVAKYNGFLRDNKLGYFSESAAEYFLPAHEAIIFSPLIESNARCQGQLLAIEKISQGNYKFTARAYTDAQAGMEHIIVLDSKHKVVGLGRNHRQKGEFLPLMLRDREKEQWTGFIRPLSAGDYPLTFIAKDAAGYCQLFSTI